MEPQEKSNYRKVLEAMNTPLDSELELLGNLCEEMQEKGKKDQRAAVLEMIKSLRVRGESTGDETGWPRIAAAAYNQALTDLAAKLTNSQ